MDTKKGDIFTFLKDLKANRNCTQSRLASDLGVSHATVSRWFSGKDTPSLRSSQKLAEYTGLPLQEILTVIGHLPRMAEQKCVDLPGFREYAIRRYPELSEDVIAMIEDLIERRRQEKAQATKSLSGWESKRWFLR